MKPHKRNRWDTRNTPARIVYQGYQTMSRLLYQCETAGLITCDRVARMSPVSDEVVRDCAIYQRTHDHIAKRARADYFYIMGALFHG